MRGSDFKFPLNVLEVHEDYIGLKVHEPCFLTVLCSVSLLNDSKRLFSLHTGVTTSIVRGFVEGRGCGPSGVV